MKYGILGTGNVSQTIGSKLIQLGHEVKLGSRNPNNEAGLNWVKKKEIKLHSEHFQMQHLSVK